MTCPLCGQRKARRACPALGHEICPTCCGTKRLTEIQCPSSCRYLVTAREHPAAVTLRQQQHDLIILAPFIRDFSQRQSQLFLLIGAFLLRYPSPELQPLIDEDVADAAGALAATLETASRGVIYEHRPSSLPAERLHGALKAMVVEAGGSGGTAFDRDAAVVLRRLEEAVRAGHASEPLDRATRRAFLDLLGRVLKKPEESPDQEPPREPSRLILP